jgi:hypothetical protein
MGGAFGAGLLSGLGQGMQRAQEQQADAEYKKLMMQKAKLDLELSQQKQTALTKFSETGDPKHLIQAGVPPKDAYMASIFLPMMMQGQGQDPRLTEGMNNPPPQQQVTFPGSMTGTPQIDMNRFMEKEIYGTTTNPNDIGGADRMINRGQAPHLPMGVPMMVPRNKRGYDFSQANEATENIQFESGASPQGLPIRQGYGNITGQPKTGQIAQPVKNVYKETTGTGGEQGLMTVPEYATPTRGATPQQAQGGTVQLTIDTSKPGWRNEIDKTLDQVQKPSLVGVGGIQTKPPLRSMALPDKELSNYLDIKTGKKPPAGMSEDAIAASGQYVRRPETEMPLQDAQRFSNAYLSTYDMKEVQSRLMRNGTFDMDLAKKMWAWFKAPNTMSGTEADYYGRMISFANQAQIRMESGAAVPESEVKDMVSRANANLFSSPESILKGMSLLSDRLGATVEVKDPTGYYKALSVKKRPEYRAWDAGWMGPGTYKIDGKPKTFKTIKDYWSVIGER